MKNSCKIFILFIFIYFFPLLLKNTGAEVFAQNKNIDALKILLKEDKEDTIKVKHLYNLGKQFMYVNPDTSILLGHQALKIMEHLPPNVAKESKVKSLLSKVYNILGVYYNLKGDYSMALDFYLKAVKLDIELGDKDGMAMRLGNIGNVYLAQDNYPEAQNFFFKSLKMADSLGNKKLQSSNYSNLGIVYKRLSNYPKALDYYFKALTIAEDIGDKDGKGRFLGNIGTVYQFQGNYQKAFDYYFQALKMGESLGNKNMIAANLSSIGDACFQQEDYTKALEYLLRALKISEEIGEKNEIANVLANIGSLYTKQKKYKEAYPYLFKALALDKKTGVKSGEENDFKNLSALYEKSTISLPDSIGGKLLNMEQMRLRSMYYYKQSIAIHDTIFSEGNKKLLLRKEMDFEFEKKEAVTKAENEQKQIIAEEKNRKQKAITWAVACGLLLVIVFAGFIFRSLRITRKQNNIIALQKNEVFQQKEIVEKQKHIVEEKQKEIVDSITYASRIQRALLTSDEYISNNLPAEHFILFKPKDIVSGDFYWALSIAHLPGWDMGTNKRKLPAETKQKNKFYLATADCTGHGVPGAFMSMLNISYLNENVIERGIRMPHDILNIQRAEIIKALNPTGSLEISRDGMDCVLCVYDFDKMLLHFAAANNQLWLLRNNELIEYKGDKMPVGKYMEEMLPFTLQTIELQKGDIIYTSTDGYADQFGSNGKKLMKKIFKEELLKIHTKPLNEQKEYLNEFFENWKGNTEQLDDVCVIGVRI